MGEKFLIRYGQSEHNVFIKIKTPSKNVFPSDVERTVSIPTEWLNSVTSLNYFPIIQ